MKRTTFQLLVERWKELNLSSPLECGVCYRNTYTAYMERFFCKMETSPALLTKGLYRVNPALFKLQLV
jgi:hypothetical protein